MAEQFQVTEDRRVFFDGHEITDVEGFKILIEAGKHPEVVLRALVRKIEVDGYTDLSMEVDSRIRLAGSDTPGSIVTAEC